jgi:hypothetical protein
MKLGGLTGVELFSSAARFLPHHRLVCHSAPFYPIFLNPIRRGISLWLE